MSRLLAWFSTLAFTIMVACAWKNRAMSDAGGEAFLVFSAAERGCTLVIPRDATAAERRAAELLRETLAKAAGKPPADFPIATEGAGLPRRALYVGATRRGRDFLSSPRQPPYDAAVGHVSRHGALFLRSERRESIVGAASWFLENEVGARWFMPGPMGEHIPRREQLVVVRREVIARPGFLHRDFGVHGAEAREWYARNRFEARFEHHHNLANIFQPDDLRRKPEMAPIRAGQRYISPPNRQNWQPDFLSRAAVEHAAAVANRAFDRDPARLSFSLSTNDTDHYDESPATLAAVAPPRFFRHRPDYSDLVFRFTNAVAELVAQRHPDRWLPAYAYYWCENAPGFPIARNVVPFLTADRSRWSFPEFAAEDRALIEKWCRSGAEIVGVYDYFYGVPFFCPRPTLYAVKETIPFEYRAGVRAFYAEAYTNWALDGPKPWLTAQLLWSPEKNPDELLATYYREFWAEAAAPMRRFFELCDEAWRQQPGPPLWLRYYQDEDQSYVYTPAQRAGLREQLVLAERAAVTDAVRARVAFTRAAFALTEAFAEFCAARARAHRLSRDGAEPPALVGAWKAYRTAAADFTRLHDELRRDRPLALGPQDLQIYLRNQPDGRVVRALLRTDEGRTALRGAEYLAEVYLGATEAQLSTLLAHNAEVLLDPNWTLMKPPPPLTSAVVDWTAPGATWHGEGEPWEGRTLELRPGPDGRKIFRMAGCRTDGIGQWVAATPNALYLATAKIRARSSPGTATYLIVNFLDANWRHLGIGHVDRLTADASAVQETELTVIVRAPPNARFVGVGLRAQNQVNDDFVEFSEVSLRLGLPISTADGRGQ